MSPKPTIPNSLRGIRRTKCLLISESAAIRIVYNLARVYYFTDKTQGPCDSPNPLKLDKGALASTVPNKVQPLRVRPAWRGDLVPPRTSLNFLHTIPLGDPLSLLA